ncbi:MAG TPA: Panacea domain-containing protein [Pirellulales bacterium]|nr:Panacea domain-containing protein [Pirellulales bacterium]
MIAFDINKTIEAAAYLIKRQPGARENYMRMLKLLYLADRLSLQERGMPICGDTVYAMERGPVMSVTLDLVHGADSFADRWDRFIKKDVYEVVLKADPGNRNLSRAEIKILERVAEQFRGQDEWDMVEWCHKHLPEYEKNWDARGESKRKRIPLCDVLEAVGRRDDQKRIVAEINESAAFDQFFGNHLPTVQGFEQ